MGFMRYSCRVVREDSGIDFGTDEKVTAPVQVSRIMAALYDDCPQEVFVALYLNTRHQIIGYEEITRGILDASLVHPREIFRGAITASAAAIILAHTHPSGDPNPSPEDKVVTKQVVQAGRIIGIPVLDHVVVGCASGRYMSLASQRDWPFGA